MNYLHFDYTKALKYMSEQEVTNMADKVALAHKHVTEKDGDRLRIFWAGYRCPQTMTRKSLQE